MDLGSARRLRAGWEGRDRDWMRYLLAIAPRRNRDRRMLPLLALRARRSVRMWRVALGLCVPAILNGAPVVLVNEIPTDGMFLGESPLALPFKDAEAAKPAEIEAGLNAAITNFLPVAGQQNISFVCVFSSPGADPIEIPIAAAQAKVGLSRTHSAVVILFYRGGHRATRPIRYVVGHPEKGKATVSANFEKIAVPPGATTSSWIHFNLPRIQAEAEKAGSPVVFVNATGKGTVVPVSLAGMKDPFMVPEERTTFNAAWYMDPKMDATHRGELFGRPIPDHNQPSAQSVTVTQGKGHVVLGAADAAEFEREIVTLLVSSSYAAPATIANEAKWKSALKEFNVHLVFADVQTFPMHTSAAGTAETQQVMIKEILLPVSLDHAPDYILVRNGGTIGAFAKYRPEALRALQERLRANVVPASH